MAIEYGLWVWNMFHDPWNMFLWFIDRAIRTRGFWGGSPPFPLPQIRAVLSQDEEQSFAQGLGISIALFFECKTDLVVVVLHDETVDSDWCRFE